ncbi:dihydrofolate reductase family protein [Nocardia sp. NPDC051030]|uniref:dihydrofolate reductase family protein n=1 Tax=Nocardia sp. NPDC051030 TaxID=3155162 RepID=UPI00342DCE8F
MRKLTYYVGVSLDGYIAGPNGEVDLYPVTEDVTAWITSHYPETVPVHLRPHLGVPLDEPNKAWDTVLMGRATYEPGLAAGVESPFDHLKQYVFSRTLPPSSNPQVEIVDTDPVELVRQLKKEEGQGIWLCGGGDLAGQLIDEVDELVLKSYPVILGAGVRLFGGNYRPANFQVTAREALPGGAQVTWATRA